MPRLTPALKHWQSGVAGIVLACVAGASHALVLPKDVSQQLAARYDAFVDAPGFRRVDPVTLGQSLYNRAHFPNADAGTACGFSAGINGATIALLLANADTPPPPHARYRITYRREADQSIGAPFAVAYVQVMRFNLGPVLHAQVAANAPEGVPMAPAKEFGTGPNIAWRFVLRPVQCRMVDAVRASRKVLTTAQARAVDCLGVSCLAANNPTGPDGNWKTIQAPDTPPAAYIAQRHGVSTAARVSALLYRQASGGRQAIEPLAMHGDKPQLAVVISMNINGQDHTAEGLLRHGALRDDALAVVWSRLRDAGGNAIEWQQHYVYQPGRN